jgi:anthranilate 1,2-dioxygenase reductase subunit
MTHRATIIFRDGLTQFIQVEQHEKLLDAAFRHGIQLPLDCREGVCATCRGRCESGTIEMEYVDDEALSASELEQGYILACQTRLTSSGSFYFDIDSSICNLSQQNYCGRVSALNMLSDTVATLEITLGAEEPALHYLPGQYARIQVPGSEESRAYSYASASAQSSVVRFLIRLLPSGLMSDYLRQRCQVGDSINFTAPFGAFYLREVKRPLLFVAGGTGLSAFLSMLESLAEQGGGGQPIALYYGVNRESEISELERLDSLTQRLGNFSYQVVVADPGAEWQGKQGWVTNALESHLLQQPFDAYLCGPPPMIEATCNWLLTQPVAEHHVYFERFVSS